MKDQDNFMK